MPFSKNLSSPGIFPIRLQDDVLGWKLSIRYDLPTNVFDLNINDLPFSVMPYQAQVILKGPQNIIAGVIVLNGVQVHEGWAQFTAHTIDEWFSQNNAQPTTDLTIDNI